MNLHALLKSKGMCSQVTKQDGFSELKFVLVTDPCLRKNNVNKYFKDVSTKPIFGFNQITIG